MSRYPHTVEWGDITLMCHGDPSHLFDTWWGLQIIVQVAIKGLRPPMDPSSPEPVRRLISKCWAQDSRSRPSCADVLRLAEILIQREKRSNGSQGSLL
jgi:hypothetical protein